MDTMSHVHILRSPPPWTVLDSTRVPWQHATRLRVDLSSPLQVWPSSRCRIAGSVVLPH